jgi:hypothetical protein
MIIPSPFVISHETSLVHDPVTQFANSIVSPIFAEKFSTPIDPAAIVAPEITVLPLTNISTAFPFHPSQMNQTY